MRFGLRPRGSGRILGRRGLGLRCLGDLGVDLDAARLRFRIWLVHGCCCYGVCLPPKRCTERPLIIVLATEAQRS